MARPEKPITWEGPVANLARALRHLREVAGSPAYAQLAKHAHCSRSVLADAAAGYRCPTWKVTSEFVTACGGMPQDDPWPTLWNLANAEAIRTHENSRPQRAQRPRSTKINIEIPHVTLPGPSPKTPQGPPAPDPWLAASPAQYRYQLCLLRAWAGVSLQQIGRLKVENRWGDHQRIPYTTLHDALNPTLARMPSLPVVRAIVTACEADMEQWVGAWRAINMKRFQQDHPPPPGLEK